MKYQHKTQKTYHSYLGPFPWTISKKLQVSLGFGKESVVLSVCFLPLIIVFQRLISNQQEK
jgi:hypothetical protein